MKILVFPITLILFMSLNSFGQEKFPNTLFLGDSVESPEAKLADVSWIAGHWQGEAFGGIVEELWTPPLAGSMVGSFKLVVENKVQFYEILTISEENNTLILRLKHFYSDLKGWEEKDITVDFKLVKLESDKVYFEGFTIEKPSDNEMNVYVVLDKNDKESEAKFIYRKQSN